MKISLITTALNEEDTIGKLLTSISQQTELPDEIVIVDGGSTDKTVSSIKYYVSSIKRIKVRLIVKRGNRSVGRNTAIKNSTGEIILVSDAGCILDKNWIKNITDPFKSKEVDVVSGFYKPITTSIFEESLATYTCVMPDKVDHENFLPSSRSIAFKKKAWEKAGGYPEELDTCEDLVFDKRLKNAGSKFMLAQNAIVYWPQRNNILQAFRQFFNYAIGDGRAFYIRPQTPLLFGRYCLGIGLLFLFFIAESDYLLFIIYYLLFFYISWALWKNYRYVKHPKAFIYLPLLQFASDLAVISGTSYGLIKRLFSK